MCMNKIIFYLWNEETSSGYSIVFSSKIQVPFHIHLTLKNELVQVYLYKGKY